jgi:hypothetical protein
MPARTRGRAKFDFRGRPFVWWVDGDRYIRISSLDKKFIIAFPIMAEVGRPPVIEVIGKEFAGLDSSERRPIWLKAPQPSPDKPIGAWVDDLLRWSFDPAHELVRIDGPARFI